MGRVKLSNLIAPSFYETHNQIKNEEYLHYWLPGGRGSTKSTFAGVEIPLAIMRDANKGVMSNAMIIRRYANTLSGSVVEQIKWGINSLGHNDLWDIPKAKLEFTYKPTGQKIVFKGADDEEKLKGSKVYQGFFKYIWYEELTEFEGMEKIRSINQSLLRGGHGFTVIYTYNPPKSIRNWVNKEVLKSADNKVVNHTTYLTVPKKWLGDIFIEEAEQLKRDNPSAYEHEYMGKATGAGGEIFNNITSRQITDSEIARFDNIKEGVDYGFTTDPFVWVQLHYDKTRQVVYIFDEVYKHGLSNYNAAEKIRPKAIANYITSDIEHRTTAELNNLGLKVVHARKGPNSREFGMKWLQDVREIVIDPSRCPNTYKEFSEYQYERMRNGEFRAEYPDTNDHSIDAVRYALESSMIRRGLRSMSKKKLGV